MSSALSGAKKGGEAVSTGCHATAEDGFVQYASRGVNNPLNRMQMSNHSSIERTQLRYTQAIIENITQFLLHQNPQSLYICCATKS
jgi:hypothetical protein